MPSDADWERIEEQFETGELIKATVIDYNMGGLIVDVAGIRGFVPISQLLGLKKEEIPVAGESQQITTRLQSAMGKQLQLKIIEINRERNRIILSEKLALQEWRRQRREELLGELKPGDVRRGVVSRIANFGAFVDLGGADGLVHLSQLDRNPVNHPSEMLRIGQEVEVVVLHIDREKKKIALSIKQLRSRTDPWETIEQRYPLGQVVSGVVSKIAPFGLFVTIEEGIEGLLPLSEETTLQEGEQITVRILRLNAARHLIILGR